MLPAAALSGGSGGVDLSAGPATSGSGGSNRTGGAVFNFTGPPNVQNTRSISTAVALVVVVGLVVWLARK